jgi:glycosyltransferase involved in cell wall biosynthesis
MLYRNALALVFPSFYEGFGYPAAESLACGTPCIVSNSSSFPEAVGDLGILVDPADARQVAEAMVSAVRSGMNKRVQIEGPRWVQQFSWDQAAVAYMGIYRELANVGKQVNLKA